MIRITPVVILAILSCATAFPHVMEMNAALQKRVEPPPRAPTYHQTRPNTGLPPSGFNAKDQYVDTTDGGPHAWKAPGPNDIRGQCPGLNTAANHGFLNRNGISTIVQAIEGLGALYNMAPDLAGFLAIMAVALGGDPITETWSLGRPFTPSLPIFPARGIYGTHNKFEGDASITRGDAYLNDGKVNVFQMRSFEHLYSLGSKLTFNEAAAQADYVTRYSIMNNPYYFSAPFSGIVAPAAHNLVINLMSNHSAENPGGDLTIENFMSFFSVTGKPGSFVYTPGHERVPNNWYRRPTLDAHNIPEVFIDLFGNEAQYPGMLRFGGNTGKVNSFAGVIVDDLTGGAYNLQDLAKGNNGACFLLQASLSGLPDVADPALGPAGSILGWVLQKLGPLQQKFECPQLSKFDNTLFNQFPGYNYSGTEA